VQFLQNGQPKKATENLLFFLDKICLFSAHKPKASFIYLVLPIGKLVSNLDFSSY